MVTFCIFKAIRKKGFEMSFWMIIKESWLPTRVLFGTLTGIFYFYKAVDIIDKP